MFLLGTIVNVLSVVVGSVIGLILPRIPERMKETILQGLSLAVILIGLGYGLSDQKDILIIIVSMVIGGLIGAWVDIDGFLVRIGEMTERKIARFYQGPVAEAFVAASLVYIVGSMAIIGSIQSGISGNNTTLYAKSMLDGFSSIIFTSTLGAGVILSAIPVMLYEGGIATISHIAGSFLNSGAVIGCMTATGGLLIAGIGINILGLKKISVGNLLPGMFVAGLIKWMTMQPWFSLHL